MPRKKPSAKAKLLALSDLDRRYASTRRALALRDGLLCDLGGADHVTTSQRALAERSAVLSAIIEDLEGKWLTGEKIHTGDLCTVINTLRRLLTDLGLERKLAMSPRRLSNTSRPRQTRPHHEAARHRRSYG